MMAGQFNGFQRPRPQQQQSQPQVDSIDEASMSVDLDAPVAPEPQANGAAGRSRGGGGGGAATSAPSGQVGTAYVSPQELFADYRQSFLNVAPYQPPRYQRDEDSMDIDGEEDDDGVEESDENPELTFGQRVYLSNWRDALFAQLAVLREQAGLSPEALTALERIEGVSLQINAVIEGEDGFPRGNTAIVEDLESSSSSQSRAEVPGTPSSSSYDEEALFGPPDEEVNALTGGAFSMVIPSAREQMLDAGEPDGAPQLSSASLQQRRQEARERATQHMQALRPIGQRPGQLHPESAVQFSHARGLHLGDRGDCFLCSWRDEQHDGLDASHIRKLHDIFWGEVAVADAWSLACTLSCYYFNHIHIENGPYPPLTPEIALAHIEGVHVLEPTISLVVWIRRLEMMCSRAMATCFTRNIDGTPGPMDKDQVGCFNTLNKLLIQWRSLDPKKMAFSNTATQTSHTEMARPFNINALITTRREKARSTPARFFA